jgi:hypothetical protein
VAIGDAGANACRLLAAPAKQAFKSYGALALSGDGVDVVFNDNGSARVAHASVKTQTATDAPADATFPPCAPAGQAVFCADKTGAVHRAPRDGGDGPIVAHAPAGARIYGVPLGDQSVVAYIASRKNEGDWVSEAFASTGSGDPVRISDDGTGATSLALAPRGAGVLAVIVDARSSMTTIHARKIGWKGALDVGGDVAVDVIGAAEGESPNLAIATPKDASQAAFAVMPIAKDFSSFGVAHVRIDEPPKGDEPVAWSMYANGINGAFIAASHGGASMIVARMRPASADANAPRVLEIGRVDDNGTFTAYGLVATHGAPTEAAIELDAKGTLWLLYSDTDGSWLEARACP